MKYNHITKQHIESVVRVSKNYAEVLRSLGMRIGGGNYETIKNKVLKYNIDVSHFLGAASNKGKKFKKQWVKPEKYLILHKGKCPQSYKLKKWLIRDKILEEKCSICGNKEWEGKTIPLELHHIDGNHFNCKRENLKLICPNCHAQTGNYRGKALKKRNKYE